MTILNTCRRQDVERVLSKRISQLCTTEEVEQEQQQEEEEIKICTDDFVEPTVYVNKYFPCGITTYYEQLKKYSQFKIKLISTPEEIKNREINVVFLNDRCAALKDEVDIQAIHFSEIKPSRETASYITQIKNSQKLVCIQKRIKKIIEDWMQISGIEKKIHSIPACYDIPTFDQDLFPDEYGLEQGFILGSGGGARKRAVLFIELARRNPNKVFVLSREKDICPPDLPNLHCIGFVSREMYLSAVAACKMFICVSRSEGIPYVILEALSQGKTVISSNYGGELIIEDGKSGYVFNNTIDDLDRVFKHALQHPINGIDRLKEGYYSPKIVKKLDELFISFLPLVSIGIPNYNGAKFLEQSLESVLAQNYPNIEIIIVDSNSTDNSPEILTRYAHNNNNNITAIYQPERTGIATSLNVCLRNTKGKYFVPWHSDDIMLPRDSISRRVLELSRRPSVGMVYGILKLIDKSNKEIGKWDPGQIGYRELQKRNPIANPATMFRMDTVRQIGGYDEEIEHGEDYYLNLAISKRNPILYAPFIVAHYRHHSGMDSIGRDYTKWDKMIREKVLSL